MNTRSALILAVTGILLLIGCTTTSDERHVKKLMRHPDWPRIQHVAETEVRKRELSWPAPAAFLPMEHKDKVWGVGAMTGKSNGDVERTVMLLIADDGSVLGYKRYLNGSEISGPDQRQ